VLRLRRELLLRLGRGLLLRRFLQRGRRGSGLAHVRRPLLLLLLLLLLLRRARRAACGLLAAAALPAALRGRRRRALWRRRVASGPHRGLQHLDLGGAETHRPRVRTERGRGTVSNRRCSRCREAPLALLPLSPKCGAGSPQAGRTLWWYVRNSCSSWPSLLFSLRSGAGAGGAAQHEPVSAPASARACQRG
jgi:hypothetical protein